MRCADPDVAAEVRYQPIVELSSDRLAGFETVIGRPDHRANVASARAVTRSVHPLVPIVDISHRVLAQICADLAHEPHRAPVAVSLDVSLRELQEPGYVDGIRRALRAAVAAPALIIELPAVPGLCEIPGLSSTLDALTALGVRLSLDHIGRGCTPLFELARLPLAIVKLSAPDFAADPRTPALLPGIVDIAQRLGLATVAQDIDCPDQRELMHAHGCELGQGRLIGEPVDAAHACALIDASTGERSPADPDGRAPGPDRDRHVR
jgi:EAL domain-containing protein (putative c-di-GMP-specific phosphodiesterase class I)